MAITDRNLTAGTKLWAKYKGEIHRAEVVHAFPGGDESTKAETRYRLTLNGETKDYKSPSAAGGAIFGVDKEGKARTCNGWAFWTVGEPTDETGPARTTKAPKPEKGAKATAAPKPERKARTRKPKAEAATDGNGKTLPIIERLDDQYECGECGATFPNVDEVGTHIAEAHPA